MKSTDMTLLESQLPYTVWARQLQREFADICYLYSLPLRPAIIEIMTGNHSLGKWQATNRTIGISSHLIRNYNWDVTVNVLKHEMAHMICSEMFQIEGPPHDDNFHKACDLVGLPSEYCRAKIDLYSDLPDCNSETKIPNKRQKLLNKIQKILALTDSANEHEAVVALQAAGRIMEKYRLDGYPDLGLEEITYRIIITGKKRLAGYQGSIVSILSCYFKVNLICSQLYDPVRDEVFKTFEIFGRQEDVEVAEHCYYFLENRLACLWQTYRHELADSGRNARKSYYLGVLQGFKENLQTTESKPARMTREKKSCLSPALSVHPLSVSHDSLIRQCIRKRHPRLRTVQTARQYVSKSAYDQGRAAGKDIILHKVLQPGKDKEILRLPR